MKKFIIIFLALIFLIGLSGMIFFLVDKGEYYSKGQTIFTINEDMGNGVLRRIGLGYVMYTRNTGFPTNDNDNIIASWFNAPARDKAFKILLGENAALIDLVDTDAEIVQYYTKLIMHDLNRNATKFNLEEIKKIYINLNSFEDLDTGRKISAKAIVAILDVLNSKLDIDSIKVENKSIDELEKESISHTDILKSIKDGIYVDITKVRDEDQVEVLILKSTLNTTRTKYDYDLSKLNVDSSNYEIFTEAR